MQFVIFIMATPTSKAMLQYNPTLILEFIATIHPNPIRAILGICQCISLYKPSNYWDGWDRNQSLLF